MFLKKAKRIQALLVRNAELAEDIARLNIDVEEADGRYIREVKGCTEEVKELEGKNNKLECKYDLLKECYEGNLKRQEEAKRRRVE